MIAAVLVVLGVIHSQVAAVVFGAIFYLILSGMLSGFALGTYNVYLLFRDGSLIEGSNKIRAIVMLIGGILVPIIVEKICDNAKPPEVHGIKQVLIEYATKEGGKNE